MNITTSSKQERLKRIFTHNFREKALSVVCAAATMLLAFCFTPVHQIYTFKIKTNIASDQILVFQNTDSIEVKVSGTFFDLRKINSENLEINFDFSSEKAGEISRTASENLFPASLANLETESVIPQTIIWRTETKIEKNIPVTIVFEEEKESVNYTAEPDEIKIIGAESVLKGLDGIDSVKIPKEAFSEKTEIEIGLVFPKFTAPADGITSVKVMKKADETASDEIPGTQKSEENSEKTETEE